MLAEALLGVTEQSCALGVRSRPPLEAPRTTADQFHRGAALSGLFLPLRVTELSEVGREL